MTRSSSLQRTVGTDEVSSRNAAVSITESGDSANSHIAPLRSYSVPTKGGDVEAAGKPAHDQPGEISPDTVTVNLHARHCTSRRDRMRPMRRGSSGSGLLSPGSLVGGPGGGGEGDGPSSSSGASRGGGGGGGDDDAPDDATSATAVDVEGGSTRGSRSSFDASGDSTERESAPPPPPPYGWGSGGSSSGDSAGRGSSALGGAARMRLRGGGSLEESLKNSARGASATL